MHQERKRVVHQRGAVQSRRLRPGGLIVGAGASDLRDDGAPETPNVTDRPHHSRNLRKEAFGVVVDRIRHHVLDVVSCNCKCVNSVMRNRFC